MICTEVGEFIGYKKSLSLNKKDRRLKDYIIKILIPEDARRMSGTSNECWCDKAKILGYYDLYGNEIDETKVNDIYEYKLNEYIFIEKFKKCRWDSFDIGIRFFMTFDEAVEYEI